MNITYVFTVKQPDGKIRTALYGSVVSMHAHEKIIIGGKEKSIVAIRKLLKAGEDRYEDGTYLIEKMEIIRSKSKSKK